MIRVAATAVVLVCLLLGSSASHAADKNVSGTLGISYGEGRATDGFRFDSRSTVFLDLELRIAKVFEDVDLDIQIKRPVDQDLILAVEDKGGFTLSKAFNKRLTGFAKYTHYFQTDQNVAEIGVRIPFSGKIKF